MPHSELVQSLLRGLDILKHISTRPDGMRLNELTVATGLKKPTLHNLLRTLAARGFVFKDNMNRFNIGPALYEISASGTLMRRQIKAQSKFASLAEELPGCTITLSTLSVDTVRCLLRISPDAPGEIQRPTDRSFTPYVMASAIVLQAVYPEKSVQLEKRYPFDEYGVGMWGSQENFSAEKQKVLQDGFCRRISRGTLSLAFAMPECYVLGFYTPAQYEYDIEKYREAASNFRNAVWGD